MPEDNQPILDKRLVERLIRHGKMKRAELDKRLSSLEDTAQNGEVMDVERMLADLHAGRRRLEGK